MRLDETGACRLNSPYTRYPSLYDKGVGGLKTGLPPWRDGFTPQQIDLGRLLFFDPLLSVNQTVACSSCHDPALGFSDGRTRSVGVRSEPLARSAPSLWNVTFMQRLKWDGGAKTLEDQMLGPLYSAIEMGNTPEQLLARLNSNEAYRRLFQQAFGSHDITLDALYTALVAFETSLVSLNSRYDWYAHGQHDALNQQELNGLNVFRSFVARCAECHTPPTFSNQQIAVLGVPEAANRPLDPGAQAVTGDASQRGGFRVPSLRNVALTAPYMHAGNFATLRETVAFYTGGRGHGVPQGEDLKLHWHIWEPNLTEQELDDVVAFLGALTDQSFMPVIPTRVPSGLPVGRAANIQSDTSAKTFASASITPQEKSLGGSQP